MTALALLLQPAVLILLWVNIYLRRTTTASWVISLAAVCTVVGLTVWISRIAGWTWPYSETVSMVVSIATLVAIVAVGRHRRDPQQSA